jgi:hypothetical protein
MIDWYVRVAMPLMCGKAPLFWFVDLIVAAMPPLWIVSRASAAA